MSKISRFTWKRVNFIKIVAGGSFTDYALVSLHNLRIYLDESYDNTLGMLSEMHDRLLSSVRGDEANPVGLCTTQNFIHSTPYIQQTKCVPIPQYTIRELFEDLLEYASQDIDLHLILQIGVIHHQFDWRHMMTS